MSLRNLSPATQRSCIHAVAKFSQYFLRSPDHLSLEDVRAYQVQRVARGLSWPALNQIVCALRLFYGITLGQADLPGASPIRRSQHGDPARPAAANASFLAAVCVPPPKLRATFLFSLDWRTWNGAIGAKHAAISRPRLQTLPTSLAVVEDEACVGRHTLQLFPVAVRAGQRRITDCLRHARWLCVSV